MPAAVAHTGHTLSDSGGSLAAQNPDSPAEMERITRLGGYVSPPPEPGLSARVSASLPAHPARLACLPRVLAPHSPFLPPPPSFPSCLPACGCVCQVWLDPDFTQVGLAMARSIGDRAVKGVGVIAEPEVLMHDFTVSTASQPAEPSFCSTMNE